MSDVGLSRGVRAVTAARRSLLAIVAAVAAVHGLLLFNDGVYWDGHIIYAILRERSWTDLLDMFKEMGAPAVAYVHWTLGLFPNFVFAYKLAAFLSILAAAIAIWRLALESNRVSDEEALWIALLAMAYPGYRGQVELILIPREIAYACFLWAALIDVRVTRRQLPAALHLVTATMFVASFILPSLMMWYFGYLLFAALVAKPRRVDWLMWAIPVVAFVAGQIVLRPTGNYAGYNTPAPSVNAAVMEIGWFLRYAVWGSLNAALASLLEQPLLAVLALGAGAAFGLMRGERRATAHPGARTIAFALVLFILGAGPYAVVGHHPPLDGWSTRHAQLVALPLAIAIVAVASIAERRGWLAARSRVALLVILFVASGLSLTENYVIWQARWAKDASIVATLAQRPEARRYSVFLVNDQAQIGPEGYQYYEWSSMFRRAWGDERHAAMLGPRPFVEIERTLAPLIERRFLNMTQADLKGCEAIMTIRKGLYNKDPFTVAVTYTYTRIVRPSRLPAYLAQITAIDITPYESAAATHCQPGPT